MIGALVALAWVAQVVEPTPPPARGDEVVVVARRIGRATLLWDMTRDGRLTNCRIFRSSGNAMTDRDACTAPPPCPDLAVPCLALVPRRALEPLLPGSKAPPLDMSKLKPLPRPTMPPGSAGPKLPP